MNLFRNLLFVLGAALAACTACAQAPEAELSVRGLAGIVIEPTDDLIRFQKKLIDAVAPYTVKVGTKAAFVTTREDPEINQPTIDYVQSFVPDATGDKFNPHVTIGLASQEYLKPMLEEKFEAFTFSPAGVSVYKLGNLGTAREKLKGWDLSR